MAKKFIVDRISDCIRVYPENQTAHGDYEVKKRKVIMFDYGTENGFSITPQKLEKAQAGTVFKIKDFPCCTIHKSKTKFFIRLSFTKATCKDAEKMVKRDAKEWFSYLQDVLKEEEKQTTNN